MEAAAQGRYDAVLLDVALPDADGLETTRRIRSLPGPAGQVAIIGVAGRSDGSDESAARAAGMNGYLVKPLSPATLAQALAALPGQDG